MGDVAAKQEAVVVSWCVCCCLLQGQRKGVCCQCGGRAVDTAAVNICQAVAVVENYGEFNQLNNFVLAYFRTFHARDIGVCGERHHHPVGICRKVTSCDFPTPLFEISEIRQRVVLG